MPCQNSAENTGRLRKNIDEHNSGYRFPKNTRQLVSMNPSTRIILNTLAAYARSVLAAGLALFSGRWVLEALGASDFGLFSVVGAIIVFITFLNGVMSASASRHLAIAIGRGELEEANKWFNTALGIHLLLPTVLIVIGLPAGEYCIRNIFTIPPDRIGACIWVFRMSLVVAFVNMSASRTAVNAVATFQSSHQYRTFRQQEY